MNINYFVQMTNEPYKEILRNNRVLFWDVNVENIDREKHAGHIIERFLEYGTLEGVQWLRKFYGDERIKEYILKRGFRVLSNKTLNFWKLILNLEGEECLKPFSLSRSKKYWNY